MQNLNLGWYLIGMQRQMGYEMIIWNHIAI